MLCRQAELPNVTCYMEKSEIYVMCMNLNERCSEVYKREKGTYIHKLYAGEKKEKGRGDEVCKYMQKSTKMYKRAERKCSSERVMQQQCMRCVSQHA